jgi:hypothetical protein
VPAPPIRRRARAWFSHRAPASKPTQETDMKGIGLWLLGVPVIVIIALYLFGVL